MRVSERLEEIKTDVESMYNALNRDDVDGFLDIAENFIDNGYFERLIEQAELVKDLENKVKTLEEKNNELTGVGGMWMSARNKLEISEQQNKRYREAIEEALIEDDFEDAHNQLERIVNTLNQSMESESECK